jgi:UDP-glucose 4-epimerase
MGTSFLVTGGAGFIGTHLAERLAGHGPVTLFDNFRRNSLAAVPELLDHPDVRLIEGDVLDSDAVHKAMVDADVVVHLAAIAGVSSYYQEPLRTLQVNMLGTANMLEAAGHSQIDTFVQFSTSEVFGPNAMFVDEDAPYQIGPVSDRRWSYATSKLAGEQLALRAAEQYGFRATVVRPFNVYGPRQTGEGAISNFCTAVAQQRPLTVYGDGSALRAWCYVDDLVAAVLAILDTPEAAGQAFNIGNPLEVTTTADLARRIVALEPSATIERRHVDRAEVRARVPVIDRARSQLGWEPKVDLTEGLSRTLAWFRQTHS